MKDRINPWISLIPVIIGVFMVMLDTSILNIALPEIAQDFRASASDVQWLLNAYLITLVVLLITMGRIGDMVRRNLLYTGGMAIFTLGSYLCAESWSIGAFVTFRIVQAVGGAILTGNSMALITELFPAGKRGAAMGVQSILIASSFALGPVVGGWLTTRMGWHWVFYINVPIGIMGVIIALLLLPSTGRRVREPIDIIGLMLLAVGLGFFTLGIIQGQDWGWRSEKTMASFLISFSYLIAFGVREITYDHPILDLSLFKIRNYSTGILSLFFLSLGLSTSMLLLPFFLQGIKGLSAEESGYWILPLPIINTVIAPMAGRLSDRINPKIIMSLGPVFFSTGLFLLSRIDMDVRFWDLIPIFLVLGGGMGMLMPVAMNVMMSSVPIHKAGMASGTIQTSNSLARAMGVAFGGVLFTGKMNDLIPGYGNQIPGPMQIEFLRFLAGKGFPGPLVMIVDSFMKSLHQVFLDAIPLVITSLLIILLFLKGREHLRVIGRTEPGVEVAA